MTGRLSTHADSASYVIPNPLEGGFFNKASTLVPPVVAYYAEMGTTMLRKAALFSAEELGPFVTAILGGWQIGSGAMSSVRLPGAESAQLARVEARDGTARKYSNWPGFRRTAADVVGR